MRSIFRTRTDVSGEQSSRLLAQKAARRADYGLAAISACAQATLSLMWIIYPTAGRASWQAALMLIAPAAVIYVLWQKAAKGGKGARGVRVMLLPCLMLDGGLSLMALYGLSQSSALPRGGGWLMSAMSAMAALLSAFIYGGRGIALGAFRLRYALLITALLCTVAAQLRPSLDNLWPVMGYGAGRTARAALMGSGGVWGFALFHMRAWRSGGGGVKEGLTLAVWPIAICLLFAAYLSTCLPWPPEARFPLAERLIYLQSVSNSAVLHQLTALMWVFGLLISLFAAVTIGATLMTDALPRLPRLAACAVMAGGSYALSFFDEILLLLSPWRAVLCLLCAVVMLTLGRRSK